MSLLPLFINEKSFPSEAMERRALVGLVLEMLSALKSISKICDELILASNVRLSDAQLTNEFQTLASLANDIDRDWWRMLKGIENRAPIENIPHTVAPVNHEDIRIDGTVVTGAHWAYANSSFVLSFPWRQDFRENFLSALLSHLEGEVLVETNVDIQQISTNANFTHWSRSISDYGVAEAASSLVYQDGLMSLRMYLDDHDPPHVHVFCPDAPNFCRAKARFDQFEFLKSSLTVQLESHVLRILRDNENLLRAGWERCRAGRRPIAIIN